MNKAVKATLITMTALLVGLIGLLYTHRRPKIAATTAGVSLIVYALTSLYTNRGF